MDKKALVDEVKSVFKKMEEGGIQLECVYMIPVITLFRNESYTVVVGTPMFRHLSTRDKIVTVSQKIDEYISPEARRHIQMVWVFDDVEQARRRIDIEDVDDFITPIIEPAHA